MAFPNARLNEVSGEFVGQTVDCLMELGSKGIPATDRDLRERIENYFRFCADRDFRPGIESLCLALGTSRQNFWKWCGGEGGKSEQWQQDCQQAKQAIVAFLEACGMNGKVNPAVSIFALKNWAGYRDTIEVETATKAAEEKPATEYPDINLLLNARQDPGQPDRLTDKGASDAE